MNMRRSTGGRHSLAPLRVKAAGGASSSAGARHSVGGHGTRHSMDSSQASSRASFTGRPSLTGNSRSSLGGRPSQAPGGATKKQATKGGGMRLSFGYGRMSTGYGRGHELTKDPRPITDKNFREASIRKLVQFLIDNNYPHTISPKLLHSPQTKDFVKIFEFIFSFLQTGYKISSKHEDEIPKQLKMLHYPFKISKTSLYNVGSMHAWPALLAALSWLRELVQFTQSIDAEDVMFPNNEDDFVSGSEAKILFRYIRECYTQFLEGADTFEDLEAELARRLGEKSFGMCSGGVDELCAENSHLCAQLEALQAEPNRLLDGKDYLGNLIRDDTNLQLYTNQLKALKVSLEAKQKTLDQEIQDSNYELESLQQSARKMQSIFETQEYSQADVERFNQDRQELQRQIDALQRENDNLDKDIWNHEMDIAKGYERMEHRCQEYNKMAQLLKLIPADAENAHGIDYKMLPTNLHAAIDFVGTIKPALTQMKQQCSQKVSQAKDHGINAQETLEQVREMVSEKKQDNEQIGKEYKRHEDELERNKQLNQQELERMTWELDALQADMMNARTSNLSSNAQLSQEISQLTHKLKQDHIQQQTDQQTYAEFLHKVMMRVITHKERIMTAVSDRLKKSEALLDKQTREHDVAMEERAAFMAQVKAQYQKQ